MSENRKAAAGIIHVHAISASTLAGVFAQIAPISLTSTIALTTSMTLSLVSLIRPDIEDKNRFAAALGSLIGGWTVGMLAARTAIGLIPVLGNYANAAMTFTLFETVGWGIYELLKDGRDITQITKQEFEAILKFAKSNKPNIKNAIKSMPQDVKAHYNDLVAKLKKSDLSDEERTAIQDELSDLMEPYFKENA